MTLGRPFALAAAGLLSLSLLLLSGCAQPPPAAPVPRLLDRLLPTQALLLGEQHDAAEHQALQRDVVQALAARGQLGALVIEMAEQGRDTTGLAPGASEAQVREALGWTGEGGGWPWAAYGPVVMAAVRAGAPVRGGNLPRARMREAMGDATLDTLVDPGALQRQRAAIRDGHCGLLPEAQIGPMARIQIARDRAMAQALAASAAQAGAGRTVVLVAGNGHVRRDLGVPRHLPAGLRYRIVMAQAGGNTPASASADTTWPTPALPPRDHCAELRRQLPAPR